MIIDFAPEEGRLRLDIEAFKALVAGPEPDAVAHLREVGLLDGDAVHAAIRSAVDAVRSPVCTLDLEVAGMRGAVAHRMWFAPAATACLLHVSGDLYQLFVVDPTHVPGLVARVVHLGPRPRLTPGSVRCPTDVVAGLAVADDAQRAASLAALARTCPPEWAGPVDHLRDGRWRMWSARTTWPGPDGVIGGRVVTVIDTRAGVIRVDETAAVAAATAAVAVGTDVAAPAVEATLTATAPTEIWFDLVRLLPRDEELPLPLSAHE